MFEAAWACCNSDDLARFIREAPSTKRPGSTEIGLMGKNSRNATAAVPLWDDLFERPGSWSVSFSAAAARGYAEAVRVTKEKINGLDYYAAKNVVNLIYDVDTLLGGPHLMAQRDRAHGQPFVGPGPAQSIAWLTKGEVRKKRLASTFINDLTPTLGVAVRALCLDDT
eukprot:6189048-Lingulodinium_polyedra.AAC.1